MKSQKITAIAASVIAIVSIVLLGISLEDRNEKQKIKKNIKLYQQEQIKKTNEKIRYKNFELNNKEYFSEANKCRESQDISKDTYFDQTYRECMEEKGYDPYEAPNKY